MAAPTAIRALAVLVAALVVAACGAGTPTGAPTASSAPSTVAPPTQGPATQAPATQAPVATDDGIPTFAIPSFHGDLDLEEMIPDEIGGLAVETLSMTGDQFVGSGADAELTAALATLNKEPSDLSVAFGGNALITIIAFQIDGASGSAFLDAFKAASQADSTVTPASFGGKSVQKVTPADGTEDTSYVYAVNDVVFAVGGDDLTDELLDEVFSKLP